MTVNDSGQTVCVGFCVCVYVCVCVNMHNTDGDVYCTFAFQVNAQRLDVQVSDCRKKWQSKT